ncbi:MAG: DUF1259 domain-containing protein [Bauldia sp.]
MTGMFKVALLASVFASALWLPASAAIDWGQVDQAMGKKGATQADNVYKFTMPRSDLKVTLDGVQLQPAFALGTHIEFLPMGDQVLYMGDLVLTEDEIEPVMKKLLEGGVDIAGIHNHIIRATPTVMYMHIMGMGEPTKVAGALHAALALSKTPFETAAAAAPPALDLDTAAIDKTIGAKGTQNGSVYQYSVPPTVKLTEMGTAIPPAMGTAHVINFQPTGGGKAAITGDFTLLAEEVNPVARAFRDNGIDVTALHSHVMGTAPAVYFLHYYANDDALKLAKGLRAALDKANVRSN